MHVGINLLFLAPGEMGGLEVYSRELVAALAARDDLRLTLFVNRLAGPDWTRLAPTVVAPVDPRRRVQWVAGEQLHVPRLAPADGLRARAQPRLDRAGRRALRARHYDPRPPLPRFARDPLRRARARHARARAARGAPIAPGDRAEPRPRAADLIALHELDPASRSTWCREGIGQAPAAGGDAAAAARAARAAADGRSCSSVSAKRPHKNLGRLHRRARAHSGGAPPAARPSRATRPRTRPSCAS